MYIVIRLKVKHDIDIEPSATLDINHLPTVIHKTLQEARTEAERLASRNPSAHFGVFQCSDVAVCTINPVGWFKL